MADHSNGQAIKFFPVVSIFLPLFMAALRSRCGHYIFALWYLSSIYLLFFLT